MRHISYSFAAFDEPEALILEAPRTRPASGCCRRACGRWPIFCAAPAPRSARRARRTGRDRSWCRSRRGASRWRGEIGKRWLFVDDFIASGGTYRATFEAVHDAAEEINVEVPKLVGAYLYDVGDPDSHEGLFTTAHMPA
jgi:hypothetical protein